MNNRENIIKPWLIIGVLTGFIIIVFFIVNYLNSSIICDLECNKRHQIYLMLGLISLCAMFIGSLTYHFISERYEKKIIQIHKDATTTLKFLEPDQRQIITLLINNIGSMTQSEIVTKTKLTRVKISRILKKISNKGLIIITQDGMTNQIKLNNELIDLFVKNYK